MDDRKKHGWPFWAAVALIAAVVLYPLSFGPYIWLANRGFLPSGVTVAYEPLTATVAAAPEFIQDWHYAYIDLWLPAALRDAPVPIHTVTLPDSAAAGAEDSSAGTGPPE